MLRQTGITPYWVHQEICAELDAFLAAAAAGQSPRLMLCMPPRHGKSELASRLFPAYAFGRYPDMSIIGTSYSADLSSRFNRDIQRIIEQPEYRAVFPRTTLSAKNIRTVASGNYLRNSDLFEIVGHKGSYRAGGRWRRHHRHGGRYPDHRRPVQGPRRGR